MWISLSRSLVQRGTAGEAEVEQTRHLVEGFAGSVVDRGAEFDDGVGEIGDVQEMGVATRDEECDAFGHRPVFECVDGDVPAEMIHRIERYIPRQRIRLGRSNSDEQRAREARPDGDGDGIRLDDPGGFTRPLHSRHDRFQVGTRGDLGHHSPEACVLVDTRGHLVGQQRHLAGPVTLTRRPFDDPDSGFVTRTLHAHHDHVGSPPRPDTEGRAIV